MKRPMTIKKMYPDFDTFSDERKSEIKEKRRIEMKKYEEYCKLNKKSFHHNLSLGVVIHNERTNKYYGYVENSFSMGFEQNRVRIFNPLMYRCDDIFSLQISKAELNTAMQKVVAKYRKQYADKPWIKVFIINANSPKCKFKVDFTNRGRNVRVHNYDYRNLPFEVKEL